MTESEHTEDPKKRTQQDVPMTVTTIIERGGRPASPDEARNVNTVTRTAD